MKRKEGQSYEDYRKERAILKEREGAYLKGRQGNKVWVGGTYNVGKNEAKRQRRNGK